MKYIIEFCASNAHFDTDQALEPFQGLPDHEVIEYGCLTHCGQCYLMPFAYVNGEMVEAQDAQELFRKVSDKIQEIKDDSASP